MKTVSCLATGVLLLVTTTTQAATIQIDQTKTIRQNRTSIVAPNNPFEFDFFPLPPAAGDATLTFSGAADINDPGETVSFWIEGTELLTIDPGRFDFSRQLTLTDVELNAFLVDRLLEIDLILSNSVNLPAANRYLSVNVSYEAVPVPASAVLLLSALVAMRGLERRRCSTGRVRL